MTITCQPSLRSAVVLRRSRLTFELSLVSQKSGRVLGSTELLQLLCMCQKQPCTKTTARRAGSTISGLPGKSRRLMENRKPKQCRMDLTRFSGPVSRPLIRLIFQLRCSGVSLSLMVFEEWRAAKSPLEVNSGCRGRTRHSALSRIARTPRRVRAPSNPSDLYSIAQMTPRQAVEARYVRLDQFPSLKFRPYTSLCDGGLLRGVWSGGEPRESSNNKEQA